MVRVHGYRLIVKPAMYVLVGSCITGAIAIPMIRQMPEHVQATPKQGYLHPERWKFESRQGAVAQVLDVDGQPIKAMTVGSQGLFQLDLEKGVTVKIVDTRGQETVYLRNGLNLAEMKTPSDMVLRFEARSSERFPVLMAIRDVHKPIWHQMIEVEGDWHPYQIPLPLSALKDRDNMMMVFAIQLGAQTGTVSLRHVELREQDTSGH